MAKDLLEQILKDKAQGMTLEEAKGLYSNIREDVLEKIYSGEIKEKKNFHGLFEKLTDIDRKIEQIGENTYQNLQKQIEEFTFKLEKGFIEIKEALPDIEGFKKKIDEEIWKVDEKITKHEKREHLDREDIKKETKLLVLEQVTLKGEFRNLQEKWQKELEKLPKTLEDFGITSDDIHPELHILESHLPSDLMTNLEILTTGKNADKLHKHKFPPREFGRILLGGETDEIYWGKIRGTLSNQTDLQTALDAKVPYTGATQDLDMVLNQILNLKIENVDSLPDSATLGRIVLLTSDKHFYLDQGI